MTSYLPLTCLAVTPARCGCLGLARQPALGPGAAGACGGATGRIACDGRKRPRRRGSHWVSGASCFPHPGSWFAYDTRPCPAAGISGPAGLDNHRNPVMASHCPGGEPGHVLIDTQMGDHDDNRHGGVYVIGPAGTSVPLGGDLVRRTGVNAIRF